LNTDLAIIGELWEQMENEPSDAYLIFSKYLTMKKRSLKKLAEMFSLSTATISEYKKKYRWEERVLAYDKYMSELQKEEYELMIKETCMRHAKISQSIQEVLLAPVSILAEKLKDIGSEELKEMSVGELMQHVYQIAKVLKPVIDVERISKGMSTENVSMKSDDKVEIIITPANNSDENKS